tara:strand:- start:906 stop:1202 length:297 start_codon:yes stop_codon:yes gene_type:complete
MPVSTPYKMSDFYGYDQDCSTLTSFTSAQAETGLESCLQSLNQTYFHDGSGARPVANDKVYTDSAGNNVLASGTYRLNNNTRFTIFGNSGVVASVDSC